MRNLWPVSFQHSGHTTCKSLLAMLCRCCANRSTNVWITTTRTINNRDESRAKAGTRTNRAGTADAAVAPINPVNPECRNPRTTLFARNNFNTIVSRSSRASRKKAVSSQPISKTNRGSRIDRVSNASRDKAATVAAVLVNSRINPGRASNHYSSRNNSSKRVASS